MDVEKTGGEPAEGTMTSGKYFRVWMGVKAGLTGKDRKAILNFSEYGKDVAKGTYEKSLEDDVDNLNAEQEIMIKASHTLLKADHDKVKSL